MISERLKIIEDIISGSSSKLREPYFDKNHNGIYLQIMDFTNNLQIPFIQKIWHWVNDYQSEFLCRCGSKTSFNRNWRDGYRKYCSPKCAQTNDDTKIKRKTTNLEKWGVENAAQSEKVKSKTEETNIKRYGSKSSFQNREVRKKWKENFLEKWGSDHPFKVDEIKDSVKNTNLKKWGKSSFTKTEEYIQKTKRTNREKFGKDWYTQTEDWEIKTKERNLQKFGEEWYQRTQEFKDILNNSRDLIKEKTIETNKMKWGRDWYAQTEDWVQRIKSLNLDYVKIQEKSKETTKERWGVEFYPQTQDWRNKTIQKNREKWGRDWYSETDEWKDIMKSLYSTRLSDLKKAKTIKILRDLGFQLIKSDDGIFTLISKECGHQFTIKSDTFYKRNFHYLTNPCVICNPIEKSQSSSEIEVIDWLKSLGISLQEKNREICEGYEVDIFILDKKLAIEFNGLWWHSDKYRHKEYHLNKTRLCQEKGIDLIHIWEDDWKLKKNIIKSIISNRLGIISDKIGARNCQIREVGYLESSEFLDNNHIQGSSKHSKSFGLFYGKNLVSIMTFGFRATNGKREYELIRFCNKIGTNIQGAASKLFNHFIKTNPHIDKVVSYADRSIFTGGLYKTLLFNHIRHSGPNYWWVVDGIRRHRFSFNKKKLVKMGHDPLKTEVEIMESLGNFRIWGAGQDRWEWIRK